MLTVVGGLVRNLVLIIFLNALLEMLLPQEGFRRYIRLVTGLIVVLMVVGTITALLGKLPRLEPVIAGAAPPGGAPSGAAEGVPGTVALTHRRQVLQQCRDGLREMLREELAAGGEWELAEAVITLDEAEGSDTFGAPRQIALRVRAAAPAEEGVAPVAIGAIRVGSPEPGEAAGIGAAREAERLPGLERSLARLLGLAPGAVTVAVGE